MRRKELKELAQEQASKYLSRADFSALIDAIEKRHEVFFDYKTNKEKEATYVSVWPIDFIFMPEYEEGTEKKAALLRHQNIAPVGPPGKTDGTVYLYGFHEKHGKKETFHCVGIRDVNKQPSLLEAMLDPSRYYKFWAGYNA